MFLIAISLPKWFPGEERQSGPKTVGNHGKAETRQVNQMPDTIGDTRVDRLSQHSGRGISRGP